MLINFMTIIITIVINDILLISYNNIISIITIVIIVLQ